MAESTDRIHVGIRGMAGLLGKRLALEIQKHPDIEIICGILKNDETLKRFLYGPFEDDMAWIRNIPMYLDEGRRIVQEINESQQKIRFGAADQLNLGKMCDILVDTAAPGSREKWDQRYEHFKKPVIIQSGEYPHGKLIAPPLIEEGKKQGNIYRQGDCILSALSPILAPFKSTAKRIRVNIVMQYDQRLQDYTTNQRINALYLRDDLGRQLEGELKSLFNEQEMIMENVLQKPGLDYYLATLHLDTKKPMSGQYVRQMLEERPRIKIAPEGITSTYEIDHLLREEAHALGRDIPPIVLYSSDLNYSQPKKRDIRIRAAIYSRLIAVLPNIDAIRILARNMEPLTAMRMTDHYTGFDYVRRSGK